MAVGTRVVEVEEEVFVADRLLRDWIEAEEALFGKAEVCISWLWSKCVVLFPCCCCCRSSELFLPLCEWEASELRSERAEL